MTILPWPPGPRYVGGRLAFVYNVYTEPAHRRRGLARMIMEAIHAWCRDDGIGVAGLNASGQAQRLYESLGYQQMPAPDDGLRHPATRLKARITSHALGTSQRPPVRYNPSALREASPVRCAEASG